MEINKSVGRMLKAHLVGSNTRADRQLGFIENPLTHQPDTFVWVQVVLCTKLRDTGMKIKQLEKVPLGGRGRCWRKKLASSMLHRR